MGKLRNVHEITPPNSIPSWAYLNPIGALFGGFIPCTFLILISLFLTFFSLASYADTQDLYPFPSANQQQQFQNLLGQLRCLVCQNQNLLDSNADLAKDLRTQVYHMVLENKSDAEIKQYLTNRYGQFVLFKPPLTIQTAVLWLTPFLLLLLGGFILYRLIYSKKTVI
jgi:cytochrome c-type biogenesis protein CcmH